MVGPVDAHDAGVAAGALHRVAADQVVVLLPDPAARGHVRRAQNRFQQRVAVIVWFAESSSASGGGRSRRDVGPVIFRRLVAEVLDRQVGLDLALVDDAEAQVVGGLADDGEIEAPFAEDRLGLRLLLGAQHHQHALLAFREHHLIGGHAGLRGTGTLSRSSSMPRSPLAPISTAEQVRPAAPMSWMAMTAPRRHQFEAGFEQAVSR